MPIIFDLGQALRSSLVRFQRLPRTGKIITFGVAAVNLTALAVFFYISPAKVSQALYDWSQSLRQMRYGWLILSAIMVIISFPPFIGYGTCVSLCGFAWGLQGIYLAAPVTLVGSATAFTGLRYLFSDRLAVYSAQNKQWRALESIILKKGLPLIILIRFSPFPPYVYSNALFASIQSVALWQFCIATLFVLPKVFLSVFIGSRLALLSDGEQRGKMDTTSQMLNWISIAVGILVGMIAGWVVFRLMQREIEASEYPGRSSEDEAEQLLLEANQ